MLREEGKITCEYACAGVKEGDRNTEWAFKQIAGLVREYGGMTLAFHAFETYLEGKGVKFQAGRKYRITIEELKENQ